MTEHTKGPWRVGEMCGGAINIEAERTARPFTVGRIHIVGAAVTEAEANARLVAAVPDLLDALRALRIDANRLCDRQLGGSYEADCRRAIAIADAAIAKAEGHTS